MSDTSIEWTDRTWNPVRGCTKVSPGCKHCYAETFAERFRGVNGHPYEQGFDLRLVPEKLDEPLRIKKPARIFVNSMSDLFQDGVPDEFIAAVFGVMAAAPRHAFQILTKRPARMREWFNRMSHMPLNHGDFEVRQCIGALDRYVERRHHVDYPSWPLPNVHLGVSVENQEAADERIPLLLLKTPAAVRFLSCEPLLGRIDLSRIAQRRTDSGIGMESWERIDCLHGSRFTQTWGGPWIWNGLRGPHIDWVIVGGESGPGARPCELAWIRSIVAQCKAAGVPCFVKQLGAKPVRETEEDGLWNIGVSRKGGNPSEWPQDLRVREFPALSPDSEGRRE